MTDWSTIASLSTAGGTLVLAFATFSAVRSANRSARATEGSLLEGLRPLLVRSRPDDPAEKVGFQDNHWVMAPGGGAAIDLTDDAIYMAMTLRNVGRGIAVLDRWALYPERRVDPGHDDIETFRRLTVDLYVAPSDSGFWQGALRDPTDDLFKKTRAAIENREPMTIDLLYADFDGGQRVISRFALMPASAGGWRVSSSRHWNLDRPEPR